MRTALLFAAMLAPAAAASGALVQLIANSSTDPSAGYLRVRTDFINTHVPADWYVRDKIYAAETRGFLYLNYTNYFPGPLDGADWHPPFGFLVPLDATEVEMAGPAMGLSGDYGIMRHVGVADFIAAGDEVVQLFLPLSEPRNVLTWISPHLGTLTRTYVQAPELAGLWLILAAAPLVRRRWRKV